jgi:hypothetical protein
VKQFKEAAYSVAEIKPHFSTRELMGAYIASELRAAGFTAMELKRNGAEAGSMCNAGDAQNRSGVYTLREMHEAQFTALELKAIGFSTSSLLLAGFGLGETFSASLVSCCACQQRAGSGVDRAPLLHSP